MSPDPVTLLHDLVAIPSLSGDEGAAVDYLVAAMTRLGYDARVDGAGNAVGERVVPDPAGNVTREIMLLGHVDTVPGAIPVRMAGGVLHGRGAVDAKGAMAAFVVAGARAQLPPGTRLVVAGAVEEESATSRGARHLLPRYRPDYCIIGEPSGWDAVTLGYKGRLLLDYEKCAPAGHSAGPEPAVAEAAVAWWQAIAAHAAAFNAGRPALFDRLLPSLREIQTSGNGLTDRVRATVGLRLPEGFNTAEFIDYANDLDRQATVTARGAEPAVRGDARSPLARAFRVALRAQGAAPRFKLKTGTADMNVVSPVWNCPIVAYGPGDSRLDHTPHEQLPLADYLRAIDVLSHVLGQALC